MKPPRQAHSVGARWQVARLKAQLEELYVRSDPRDFADPEIAGDMARYLCVRVSGFLEQATAIILREHCAKNSWGTVHQFAVSFLDRTPNLSQSALLKLISRFNIQAAQKLEEFLSIEERGSSLNSLIGLRNDIAHGRQQGMSREQAWEYFGVVELIVEWLLTNFDPIIAQGKAGSKKAGGKKVRASKASTKLGRLG